MGVTVYHRRAIRKLEAATGHKIVHAAGWYYTTIEHQHSVYDFDTETWLPDLKSCDQTFTKFNVSSCSQLFGTSRTGLLMHGPCRDCDAEDGELHTATCPTLSHLITWVYPDYWPTPVHRPSWWTSYDGRDMRRLYRARTRLQKSLTAAQ